MTTGDYVRYGVAMVPKMARRVHAENVDHIFIQNASIYLTNRNLDAHMDNVFFDSSHATC